VRISRNRAIASSRLSGRVAERSRNRALPEFLAEHDPLGSLLLRGERQSTAADLDPAPWLPPDLGKLELADQTSQLVGGGGLGCHDVHVVSSATNAAQRAS